jgi:hypothetical protein
MEPNEEDAERGGRNIWETYLVTGVVQSVAEFLESGGVLSEEVIGYPESVFGAVNENFDALALHGSVRTVRREVNAQA